MKSWLLVATVLATATSGCHSFNQTYLIAHRASSVTALPQPVHPTEGKTTSDDVLCPLYELPALPATPELPINELAQPRNNTTQALDRIQQNHIHELRLYIVRLRRTLKESQERYLADCAKRADVSVGK